MDARFLFMNQESAKSGMELVEFGKQQYSQATFNQGHADLIEWGLIPARRQTYEVPK
jgi:hypothetical protein